jgi:hypothetical protein
MCRSIRRLREGGEPAPPEEIEAAARQFVRKVSGFSRPAAHNMEAFEAAVADVTAATARLLDSLEVRGASATGGARLVSSTRG